MKKILITGGTGFLGKNLADYLKKNKNSKIIFSGRSIERCRKTSLDLNLEYYPCEISNLNSVIDCISKLKPDVIIHSAATKYVDMAEKFPLECVDTNVVGTMNLLRVAKKFDVKDFIAISTDKAAPPFNNIYSITKCLMEKSILLDARNTKLNITCIRFGNLAWSTGSIFPIWNEMTNRFNLIESTGSHMTRYFYSVNQACELINYVMNNSKLFKNKIIVPDMKSSKIEDILNVWCKIFNTKWKKTKVREGDKNYESIISSFEFGSITTKKTKIGNIYLINNFKDENKKDLNSDNAVKLSIKEIRNLIVNKPKYL